MLSLTHHCPSTPTSKPVDNISLLYLNQYTALHFLHYHLASRPSFLPWVTAKCVHPPFLPFLNWFSISYAQRDLSKMHIGHMTSLLKYLQVQTLSDGLWDPVECDFSFLLRFSFSISPVTLNFFQLLKKMPSSLLPPGLTTCWSLFLEYPPSSWILQFYTHN